MVESRFNTGRIAHIYQYPHDPDARLFLRYGDLSNGNRLMIERARGVDDDLLLIS